VFIAAIFTKFSQLFLSKIKIVATRCQILRLKCTKFDFGWGSAQTPLGELTALPQLDPLAGFKGPTSKGRGGRGGIGAHSGLNLVPLLFCGSTPMHRSHLKCEN